MIEDLISSIDKFFTLPKRKRDLLKGRRVQTKIHQSACFYLPVQYKEENLKVVVQLAETEQDSLGGIEENLQEIKKELIKLRG